MTDYQDLVKMEVQLKVEKVVLTQMQTKVEKEISHEVELEEMVELVLSVEVVVPVVQLVEENGKMDLLQELEVLVETLEQQSEEQLVYPPLQLMQQFMVLQLPIM